VAAEGLVGPLMTNYILDFARRQSTRWTTCAIYDARDAVRQVPIVAFPVWARSPTMPRWDDCGLPTAIRRFRSSGSARRLPDRDRSRDPVPGALSRGR